MTNPILVGSWPAEPLRLTPQAIPTCAAQYKVWLLSEGSAYGRQHKKSTTDSGKTIKLVICSGLWVEAFLIW